MGKRASPTSSASRLSCMRRTRSLPTSRYMQNGPVTSTCSCPFWKRIGVSQVGFWDRLLRTPDFNRRRMCSAHLPISPTAISSSARISSPRCRFRFSPAAILMTETSAVSGGCGRQRAIRQKEFRRAESAVHLVPAEKGSAIVMKDIRGCKAWSDPRRPVTLSGEPPK